MSPSALHHVPASAHQRIARLATLTAVHRAFHWLHLHQPQLRLWQLEMLAIPAPPFGEAGRAEWFLDRFAALGLANVHLDGAGNALAELTPASSPDLPCILVSAHLDTVFPANTPSVPTEDGARILCPGACDNAAGLTALLGIAAALRFANVAPPIAILFAANVGEEGEGNLRGMRHIFLHGSLPRPHRRCNRARRLGHARGRHARSWQPALPRLRSPAPAVTPGRTRAVPTRS